MAHTNKTSRCDSCSRLLASCHPDLTKFFRTVKLLVPSAHIASGFRTKEEQDDCNRRRTSKLVWPESPHNQMVDGKPMSMAVDLCEFDAQGVYVCDPAFFSSVYNLAVDEGEMDWMEWGGLWVGKKMDRPHFQLRGWQDMIKKMQGGIK